MNNTLFATNPKFIDRVDGVQKVTGSAKFSAEYDFPGLVYGVLAKAASPKAPSQQWIQRRRECSGSISGYHAFNAPKLPGYESTATEMAKRPEINRGYRVLLIISFASTINRLRWWWRIHLKRAVYAASLIKATYNTRRTPYRSE